MAQWTTSTTRITIDGKTYSSVDEMPPDARVKYEKLMGMLADKDGNGVPDVLEGKNPPGVQVSKVVSTTRQFVVGGKSLQRLGDLSTPQEIENRGVTVRLTFPRIILLIAALVAAVLIAASMLKG